MDTKAISLLLNEKQFTELDIYFAQFIMRLAQTEDMGLFLAAALVSRRKREGHVCLDLTEAAGELYITDDNQELICPELSEWIDHLVNSAVVGKPGEFKPLIIDDQARLYLHRYWEYQENLVCQIRQRAAYCPNVDLDVLKNGLKQLFSPRPIFGDGDAATTDWQKVAAFIAVVKAFCIISGGPGTGKTTTIAKILALLIEQFQPGRLRIALCAPTGKAAARLQEAIAAQIKEMTITDGVRAQIPENASTIHRLLGGIPNSPYFRYNRDNRLPLDVVVVDEASMVDLALMSKLVEALDVRTRLILLGDKDQLASVESGAVFGDMCRIKKTMAFSADISGRYRQASGEKLDVSCCDAGESILKDCIVTLTRNYRFDAKSGINKISSLVNKGEADMALEMLQRQSFHDISMHDLTCGASWARLMSPKIIAGFKHYLAARDPQEALKRFDTFRVLCALRKGPFGVAQLNLLVERVLAREGLLAPRSKWYAGRPIMITENNYHLRLFNGDVGLILPDVDSRNEVRAYFPDGEHGFRKIHPRRLSQLETVFAMTIHKSQGSEFDDVILLLPDKDVPILTKELIYTGVSRARKTADIWCGPMIFHKAITRYIQRRSGMLDGLKKKDFKRP